MPFLAEWKREGCNVNGLEVKNLRVCAKLSGGSESAIVRGLDFCIAPGQRLAIVGTSGCGKTMTALAILGLLPENCRAEGIVRWEGEELLTLPRRKRRALLGRSHVLIPQSGADFLNPALSVRSQMNDALARNGIARAQRKNAAETLLRRVGFDDPARVLRSYPFQLSGGMAQRVVMAMASAGQPGLVIADEPTKGIDRDNTALFLQNLDALFPGAAVLLITHDLSVASACERLLVMQDGCAVETGETQEVLAHPQHAFTRQLLDDLPGRGRKDA